MLNNCIKEPHSHLAVFVIEREGLARLDFIQVSHLCVKIFMYNEHLLGPGVGAGALDLLHARLLCTMNMCGCACGCTYTCTRRCEGVGVRVDRLLMEQLHTMHFLFFVCLSPSYLSLSCALCAHARARARSLSLIYTHFLSLSLSLSHTNTHILAHTYSPTPSHPLPLPLPYTHTLFLSFSSSLSHFFHTHILAHVYSPTPSHSLPRPLPSHPSNSRCTE